MDPIVYDLSSGFLSGSGTIVLPGGGSVTIGGGSGYPGGGATTYPYYGSPGATVGTTTSGLFWIALLVLAFFAILVLAR